MAELTAIEILQALFASYGVMFNAKQYDASSENYLIRSSYVDSMIADITDAGEKLILNSIPSKALKMASIYMGIPAYVTMMEQLAGKEGISRTQLEEEISTDLETMVSNSISVGAKIGYETSTRLSSRIRQLTSHIYKTSKGYSFRACTDAFISVVNSNNLPINTDNALADMTDLMSLNSESYNFEKIYLLEILSTRSGVTRKLYRVIKLFNNTNFELTGEIRVNSYASDANLVIGISSEDGKVGATYAYPVDGNRSGYVWSYAPLVEPSDKSYTYNSHSIMGDYHSIGNVSALRWEKWITISSSDGSFIPCIRLTGVDTYTDANLVVGSSDLVYNAWELGNKSSSGEKKFVLDSAIQTAIEGANYGLVGLNTTSATENAMIVTDLDALENMVKVGAEAGALAETYPIAKELAEGVGVIGVDVAEDIAIGIGVGATTAAEAIQQLQTENPSFPVITPTTVIDDGGNSLFTLYAPTKSEINGLADYLWGLDVTDVIKKFFSNPIDALISLCAYPFAPNTKGRDNIKVGYIETDVSSAVVGNIFQTISMGTLKVPAKYGNFLDFAPYTKISIYLPFIGIRELKAEDVMGGSISLKYRVELVTGECVATISSTNAHGSLPLYQFNGNLGMQMPLTGGNFSNVLGGAVGAVSAGVGLATGNVFAVAGGLAGVIQGAKPDISRGGNMTGNSGFCGSMTPYLIIERPITDIPANYNSLIGTVTNTYTAVGNLSGFVQLEAYDINTIDCTEEEKQELQALFSNGFFI